LTLFLSGVIGCSVTCCLLIIIEGFISSVGEIIKFFSDCVCLNSIWFIFSTIWSDWVRWIGFVSDGFESDRDVIGYWRRNLAITIFESSDSPFSSYVRSFILYSPSSWI